MCSTKNRIFLFSSDVEDMYGRNEMEMIEYCFSPMGEELLYVDGYRMDNANLHRVDSLGRSIGSAARLDGFGASKGYYWFPWAIAAQSVNRLAVLCHEASSGSASSNFKRTCVVVQERMASGNYRIAQRWSLPKWFRGSNRMNTRRMIMSLDEQSIFLWLNSCKQSLLISLGTGEIKKSEANAPLISLSYDRKRVAYYNVKEKSFVVYDPFGSERIEVPWGEYFEHFCLSDDSKTLAVSHAGSHVFLSTISKRPIFKLESPYIPVGIPSLENRFVGFQKELRGIEGKLALISIDSGKVVDVISSHGRLESPIIASKDQKTLFAFGRWKIWLATSTTPTEVEQLLGEAKINEGTDTIQTNGGKSETIDEVVQIEGNVVSMAWTHGRTGLNVKISNGDESNVMVWFPPDAAKIFMLNHGDLDKWLEKKRVSICGRLHAYSGHDKKFFGYNQITVNEPSQIEVIGPAKTFYESNAPKTPREYESKTGVVVRTQRTKDGNAINLLVSDESNRTFLVWIPWGAYAEFQRQCRWNSDTQGVQINCQNLWLVEHSVEHEV